MNVRQALYRLKHRYPTPCIFTNIEDTQIDTDTGDRDIIQDAVLVRKCPVLPEDTHSKFYYDLAYVAANKNFTYGGDYTVGKRTILVDKRDLPSDFKIKVDTILYCRSKEYRVSNVDDLEGNNQTIGYSLTATAVEGTVLPTTITLRDTTVVTLSEVVP